MAFTLPDLPYPYEALAPYMSRETLDLHSPCPTFPIHTKRLPRTCREKRSNSITTSTTKPM